MWHVSSRSGVANCYTLVTYLLTDVANYNFDSRQTILIISGKDVAEKIYYETVICDVALLCITRRVHADDRQMFVSREISRTVRWLCGLSSWLNTRSSTRSMLSAVRALRRLPLPGRRLTVRVTP